MSEWYEPKEEDISVEIKEKEVDIYVANNRNGAIYITLTFDQIIEIYNKIKKND